MFLDTNVKAIILLVLLSMIALASHRLGFLDTHLSLMNGSHVNLISAVKEGNITSEFKQENGLGAFVKCDLNNSAGFNLCGISLALGDEGPKSGLNLAEYDRLEIDVRFRAPVLHQKLKVSFRNFHKAYSRPEDLVSLKFNTITYDPAAYETPLIVPLKSFHVENWWLAQYNIGFSHSQTDFSNVAFIEFLTTDMPVIGTYELEVKHAVLRGQLLTETELLRYIFLAWLAIVIILVTRQRNQLKRLSVTDLVTECYNRRGINQWVTRAVVKSRVCLFYIDITGFKKINDAYGHALGDELLIKFSNRIKKDLYAFHEKNAVVSRLSGDEFILAFKDLDPDQISVLIKGLFSLLQEPFDLSGNQVTVNISLGVTQSSEEVNTFNELVVQADSAMYYARKSDVIRYKVFDHSVSQDIYFRKQIAEKIKNAISEGLFHLHFMPIYNSQSLKIQAVEVLLRCRAESLIGVGPDVFIPIAEEYNLIKTIDLWVLEETFKKIHYERSLLMDLPVIFCINISSAELHNTSFSLHLGSLLDKYHIKPQWIKLEITETSFIETDQGSIRVLEEIRSLGIQLALDDFGTGYTAFNQLIHYPIDCLKIDKSFIDNLGSKNGTTESMIEAILFIAKSYKLETIAEGIEDREQFRYMAKNGCDLMQGYFLAKPMDWQNFKSLLSYPKTDALRAKIEGPSNQTEK